MESYREEIIDLTTKLLNEFNWGAEVERNLIRVRYLKRSRADMTFRECLDLFWHLKSIKDEIEQRNAHS